MKLSKNKIDKLKRKVSRDLELKEGRKNHHRIHKSKKRYKRVKKIRLEAIRNDPDDFNTK